MPLVLDYVRKFATKAIGSHLVKAHVDSHETGAEHTLENMLTGYGWRFALGFFMALWLTNPEIPNLYVHEYVHEEQTHRRWHLPNIPLIHPKHQASVAVEDVQDQPARVRDIVANLPILLEQH